MSDRNSYLDQVVANQERLQEDLRAKAPSMSKSAPAQPGAAHPPRPAGGSGSNAVDVRITGRLRWRTVVVPPNAFVVHTRRGSADPLHVGLGISLRYRPATDSYLVVPGAMQTILISAFCICKELQGVLVQAYVQWIIQDFSVAYRKLDFSGDDPMRLVNLQLNEQAQAAIKDKVATMSVGEVLSDKQPIIEELTARLRAVAEGEGGSDTGLGLRIVTVQIKEAVVSSSRLWRTCRSRTGPSRSAWPASPNSPPRRRSRRRRPPPSRSARPGGSTPSANSPSCAPMPRRTRSTGTRTSASAAPSSRSRTRGRWPTSPTRPRYTPPRSTWSGSGPPRRPRSAGSGWTAII